nr:isoflavone 3'-hydroxylase-like [Tanacetum cinerariifolium]
MKALSNKVEVDELSILKGTCGKMMLAMILNGVYGAELEVNTIINKMTEGRLRCFGHVRRRPRVGTLVVDDPMRKGRPKLRWEDRVKNNMKELFLSEDKTSYRKELRAEIRLDYGDHWRNLRRIASLELLSAHRLQTHHSIREEEVKLFVKKVYQNAMRDGTVDMKSMFFELVFNVLMMMISGKRYGDSGEDVDETRRFQEIVKETCVLMETTNLSDYLPWWKWVGGRSLEKQMVALKEKRHEFMQSLLQEQKRKIVKDGNLAGENIKKEQNFIEVLLKLQVTEPEYKDESKD